MNYWATCWPISSYHYEYDDDKGDKISDYESENYPPQKNTNTVGLYLKYTPFRHIHLLKKRTKPSGQCPFEIIYSYMDVVHIGKLFKKLVDFAFFGQFIYFSTYIVPCLCVQKGWCLCGWKDGAPSSFISSLLSPILASPHLWARGEGSIWWEGTVTGSTWQRRW